MSQTIRMGVLMIDYDYPPLLGDVDHPDSHSVETIYEKVYGLTFEKCQMGIWNEEIEVSMRAAVKNLEAR